MPGLMEDLLQLLDLNAKLKKTKINVVNNLRDKTIINDYNRLQ